MREEPDGVNPGVANASASRPNRQRTRGVLASGEHDFSASAHVRVHRPSDRAMNRARPRRRPQLLHNQIWPAPSTRVTTARCDPPVHRAARRRDHAVAVGRLRPGARAPHHRAGHLQDGAWKGDPPLAAPRRGARPVASCVLLRDPVTAWVPGQGPPAACAGGGEGVAGGWGARASVGRSAASRLSEAVQERDATSRGRRRMRSTIWKGTSSPGAGGGTRRAVQQPMVAYDLGSVVMRVPRPTCCTEKRPGTSQHQRQAALQRSVGRQSRIEPSPKSQC